MALVPIQHVFTSSGTLLPVPMSSPPAQAQVVTVPTVDGYTSSITIFYLWCHNSLIVDIDGHGLRLVTHHTVGPNQLQLLHPNSEVIQR